MGFIFFIIPFLLFVLWLKTLDKEIEESLKKSEEHREEYKNRYTVAEIEAAEKGLVSLTPFIKNSFNTSSASEIKLSEKAAAQYDRVTNGLPYRKDVYLRRYISTVEEFAGRDCKITLKSRMIRFYAEELSVTNIDGFLFYDQKELDTIQANIKKIELDAIEHSMKDELKGLTSEERTKIIHMCWLGQRYS